MENTDVFDICKDLGYKYFVSTKRNKKSCFVKYAKVVMNEIKVIEIANKQSEVYIDGNLFDTVDNDKLYDYLSDF